MKKTGTTFDWNGIREVFQCEKCKYRTIRDLDNCPNPRCPKPFGEKDE